MAAKHWWCGGADGGTGADAGGGGGRGGVRVIVVSTAAGYIEVAGVCACIYTMLVLV